MEDVKKEDFRKIQPYFYDKSIENTRLSLRIRTLTSRRFAIFTKRMGSASTKILASRLIVERN